MTGHQLIHWLQHLTCDQLDMDVSIATHYEDYPQIEYFTLIDAKSAEYDDVVDKGNPLLIMEHYRA